MADHSQRFSFQSDVIVQTIEGEALLLKLQDEEVFSLNETAARIAELIGEGRPVGAVIDALTEEYGISRDDVEHEVDDLVQALLSRGLIVVAEGDQKDR